MKSTLCDEVAEIPAEARFSPTDYSEVKEGLLPGLEGEEQEKKPFVLVRFRYYGANSHYSGKAKL